MSLDEPTKKEKRQLKKLDAVMKGVTLAQWGEALTENHADNARAHADRANYASIAWDQTAVDALQERILVGKLGPHLSVTLDEQKQVLQHEVGSYIASMFSHKNYQAELRKKYETGRIDDATYAAGLTTQLGDDANVAKVKRLINKIEDIRGYEMGGVESATLFLKHSAAQPGKKPVREA